MNCENLAEYRYTWPGRDESFICAAHKIKLQVVADAIELHLQLIPVEKGEACRQVVTGEKCVACDGCGFVASDDDNAPWRLWQELKPPQNLAVQLGLVRPEICPRCNGACYL